MNRLTADELALVPRSMGELVNDLEQAADRLLERAGELSHEQRWRVIEIGIKVHRMLR